MNESNREYLTTTDNKTYKLHRWVASHICCMGCINRGRRTYYHVEGFYKKAKYPSWKLVSKNKKQWGKKPIKIAENRFGKITWMGLYGGRY
jgi:hypothetical protein